KEWKVWTKQSFSPSGGNFGRIYLTASASDLSSDPDGFYLQLGEAGSTDAVRLFKVISGVHTEILAATPGQIATSFAIGIRIVRDNANNWSMYIDDAGGENYTLAGTVNDPSALLGTHFGFMQVYTMSNATKFYYNNVYVGDEILDLDPPALVPATVINANQIDLLFDEPLDQTTAESVGNYDIQPFLSASNVLLDGSNPALVHLTLIAPLTNGMSYTLFTDNIEDLEGNMSGSQSVSFSYLIAETPVSGDVIVSEFMCDQSPSVGLPEVEFVEIYNNSSKIFNVQDWKVGDASSNGTIQQNWLLPGDYMILTSTPNIDSFAVATAVTSFPSLNNSGDNIVLRSDMGVVLDSIKYTSEWYGDPDKVDGGYSMERINLDDPCSDRSNWLASNDLFGGTPGTQNSIYDTTPDTEAPKIDQLIALSPNYIEIYFDEGMDSTSVSDATFLIDPALIVQNNYVLDAHPSMITLQFVENIVPSQTYTIELQNIRDCWLNTTDLTGEFALPETAKQGDLVINEIMFNPLTGGYDWVEVYNASSKLINLQNWELANFDDDTIGNNKLVGDHFLLYPDAFVVFAEDSMQIMQAYPAAIPGRFFEMDLPGYSNDSGTVYLINNGQVMDKVSYMDDWHFKLLDDDDGKSLERMEPEGTSNDKNNWHTAAEAIGFATPGRINSQYYPAIVDGDFNFTSGTISPDNDGFEDVLQINYKMSASGFVGTCTIYDDRGRLIARVFDSELLAADGTFVWTGVTDKGTKATIGTYIAVFEAFDIDGGAVFAKRKAFVVAGKL
ncbi:MAG: lamin tail domain-containing protein, partial [Crocinitomicaceae bacterium]|nr:lamin tail domain-containing protein [Crocinitomicaceae bacterium]